MSNDPIFTSSSSSGLRVRPAISTYIESSISGVFTAPGHVTIKLDVLSDHQVYAGVEGDVRGVFVVTGTPSRPGTAVNLDVQLPWGEVMQVEGVVEWVREVAKMSLRHRPGMGVQFEVLPGQLELLERAMVLRQPIPVPGDAQFRE